MIFKRFKMPVIIWGIVLIVLMLGFVVGVIVENSTERYLRGIPEGIVMFVPPGSEILDYTEAKEDTFLNPSKHEFLVYRSGGQIYRLHVYNRGWLGSTESTVNEDVTPYINDLVEAAKKGNP